jgi:hypothetical protein
MIYLENFAGKENKKSFWVLPVTNTVTNALA